MADNKRKHCLNGLCRDFYPLVLKTAKKYRNNFISDSDLIQEGFLGLIKAADNYQDNNISFKTYAGWYVKAAVRQAAAKAEYHQKRTVPAGDPYFSRLYRNIPDHDIYTPEDKAAERSYDEVLNEIFSCLTKRERNLLRYRRGMIDGKTHSFAEASRHMCCPVRRLIMIEDKSIKILKWKLLGKSPGCRISKVNMFL